MNNEDTNNTPSYGEIEIFLRQGGEDIVLHKQKNLIVNSGMDLLAKAVAGQQFINGMYILHHNAGTPVSPDVNTTANYYQTTGSSATLGFQRVPVAALPSFSSTDGATYNNNTATFMAITDGNVAVPVAGNEITDGVSKVYGAALGYLDPDDMANDVLYAAVNFADIVEVINELTVLAGAQIGIRWAQNFLQP
jgi:hypothetical protein